MAAFSLPEMTIQEIRLAVDRAELTPKESQALGRWMNHLPQSATVESAGVTQQAVSASLRRAFAKVRIAHEQFGAGVESASRLRLSDLL